MTLHQLDKYAQMDAHITKQKIFTLEKFSKLFPDLKKIARLEKDSPLQYHEKLTELYDWASGQPNSDNFELGDLLLKALLINGIENNIYNLELFKKFLEKPIRPKAQIVLFNSIRQKNLVERSPNSDDFESYLMNVLRGLRINKDYNDSELIDAYLVYDFKTSKDINSY